MRRHSNIFVAVFAVFVGGGILALSVPRVISSFLLLPTKHVLKDVRANKRVPSDENLLQIHDAQVSAMDTHASGKTAIDKAFVEISLAQASPEGPGRRNWYEQAENSIEKGLLLAPANPYGWLRLTELRLRSGDKDGAVNALSLSYLSGTFERWLAPPRLYFALRLWGMMARDDKEQAKRQILWVSRFNQGALVGLARQDRKFLSIIVSALIKDSAQFNGFMSAYIKPAS